MELKNWEIAAILFLAAIVGFILPLEISIILLFGILGAFLLVKNYSFVLLFMLFFLYVNINPGSFISPVVSLNKPLYFILLFFFVQVYFIKKEAKIFFPSQFIAFLGFSVVSIFSSAIGSAQGSIYPPIPFFWILSMVFLIYLTRNLTAAKNVFWTLSIVLVFFTALSFFEGGIFQGAGTSLIENRNTFGINLVPLMPLAFALFIIILGKTKLTESLFKKGLLFASLVAAILVIFITTSRGNLIGIMTILALLFLNFPKQKLWPVLMIVLLISIPFFYSYAAKVVARFEGLGSLVNESQDGIPLSGASSVTARKNLFFDTLNIFILNPVFGTGNNTSQYLLGTKYTTFVEKLGKEFNYKDPHNVYAKVLAETGILGFAFYLMMIIFCFLDIAYAERVFKEKNEKDGIVMAKCLRISFIGLLVVNFFGNDPFYLIFLILVSLAAILKRISKDLNIQKFNDLTVAAY